MTSPTSIAPLEPLDRREDSPQAIRERLERSRVMPVMLTIPCPVHAHAVAGSPCWQSGSAICHSRFTKAMPQWLETWANNVRVGIARRPKGAQS